MWFEARFEAAGQEQVFRFIDGKLCSETEAKSLVTQLADLDLEYVANSLRMESVHIQLATTASRCECQRKQKWRPLLRPRIWSHQMTSCAVVRWLPVFWPVDRRRSLALMGRKAVMRLACLRKSPCSRSSPRAPVTNNDRRGREENLVRLVRFVLVPHVLSHHVVPVEGTCQKINIEEQ
ncbi:unnamed protein product [Durusdinium trenchii]|uniref:Uncharacterized protein n=1 Tax=Durusdinium trenchii TaxID=1381693 RepID=A0ABP0HYG6_9DINO